MTPATDPYVALVEQEFARRDPAYLIDKMTARDTREGKTFEFNLSDPDKPWYWQKDLLQWMIDNKSVQILKARQLGITWLASALGLWTMLYKPGSTVLCYRQTQEDAWDIITRMWGMLNSLPPHLWNRSVVQAPKGPKASGKIELRFPDGAVSAAKGMASTSTSGHGDVAAMAILDEYARIENAEDIMTSVGPALGKHGKLVVISTANGRHNSETGEGNHFHFLWENSDEVITSSETGLARRFLPYNLHPEREDPNWRDKDPEARKHKLHKRLEQYPLTAEEAFTFSQSVYFDQDELLWYSRNAVKKPLYRMDFEKVTPARARLVKSEKGMIRVYGEPEAEKSYALAADVSTGKGLDYSAAYVIDLSDMSLVSELHGKPDADQLAFQLHYLGKWFNTAVIAIEDSGGWGLPVITFLGDGKEGRPPYPAQYRHRQYDRPDQPLHKPFGFPINLKTRPLVLQDMAMAIREHSLPWMTQRLLDECGNFVHKETNPSPRANDGTHDDCVMACAIVLELYRTRGHFPDRRPRKKKARPKPAYPWLEAA